MTKRSSTYLKGISETGDIANQTLFEDLIDSMGVVDSGTTFDDSGAITVDSTVEYSTIRTVTGSTHTLTAATSGNVSGNYKKVRYTFDVDCTLTLTDFDETGSTLGTVNPIPAGTYDFWFFTTPFGLALLIQNNTGTTPGTLSTPTLVISSGDGQLGYVITNIDLNATAGVLEYSTDNSNWNTFGGYSFGTETGNITGLTNSIFYYVRYRNSATGYLPSAYATATGTPSAVAWTPADLGSNLVLWLDGTTGVTEAGTGVSQWNDQSGNTRHFGQVTDANRPTYNTDEVTFITGNTDSLEIAGSTGAAWVKDFHDGTLPVSDIAVKLRVNSLTQTNGIIGNNRATNSQYGFSIYVLANGSITHLVSNPSLGATVNNNTGAGFVTEDTYEWFRITSKITAAAASRSTIYNELGSQANNASSTAAATNDAASDIQIGCTGNDVLPGDISIQEMIIANREFTSQEWIYIKAR